MATQIGGIDRRHHDAAARLLDREALRDQAEHGFAHRTARHIEPARKLRHAQRLAGAQRAPKIALRNVSCTASTIRSPATLGRSLICHLIALTSH